jgi:hypothetical protein
LLEQKKSIEEEILEIKTGKSKNKNFCIIDTFLGNTEIVNDSSLKCDTLIWRE